MKGLLRKELYVLRSTFRILAVVMLFYVALSYFGDNSSMLTVMAVIMVIMLPLNSVAYDEAYRWDRYVLTAPVSRKMVVQSKFLLCALLAGLVLLIGAATGLLLGEPLVDAFLPALCVAAMSLVVSALTLPAMFKWGAQRGRLVLCAVAGAVGATIGILYTQFTNVRFSEASLSGMPGEGQGGFLISDGPLIAGILLATVLITALSYGLACRIYQKKEF